MLYLLPLWETENMMPIPIATPITVHVAPILARISNFQSAADGRQSGQQNQRDIYLPISQLIS
jgi:hypothetical protein